MENDAADDGHYDDEPGGRKSDHHTDHWRIVSGKALKPDHRYSDENESFAGRSRCDLSEYISGKPGCVSVDRIYAAVSGRILCGTVKDC